LEDSAALSTPEDRLSDLVVLTVERDIHIKFEQVVNVVAKKNTKTVGFCCARKMTSFFFIFGAAFFKLFQFLIT